MLNCGMYMPPSQFESFFISLALEDKMIEEPVEAVKLALTESDVT
jgi:glutamate-1-semialdehyde aminotransferase